MCYDEIQYWLKKFEELIRKIERYDDAKRAHAVLKSIVNLQNNSK